MAPKACKLLEHNMGIKLTHQLGELAKIWFPQYLSRHLLLLALLGSAGKELWRPKQSQEIVFISQSSENRRIIENRLLPTFNDNNIEYWYSTVDIQSASEWERSIQEGLEQCDWFLIALSPDAIKSQWVKDELFWAIDNRPERIIPVMIEECDRAMVERRAAASVLRKAIETAKLARHHTSPGSARVTSR